MLELKHYFFIWFSSSFQTLKEELGLARGLKVSESLWKRLAEDLFKKFDENIEITDENELSVTVKFIAEVLTTYLGINDVETTITDESASIRLNDCPFWKIIQENKLPPAVHQLGTVFIETLGRLKSPGLIFDKVGMKTTAQGGDYCEYTWKLF